MPAILGLCFFARIHGVGKVSLWSVRDEHVVELVDFLFVRRGRIAGSPRDQEFKFFRRRNDEKGCVPSQVILIPLRFMSFPLM